MTLLFAAQNIISVILSIRVIGLRQKRPEPSMHSKKSPLLSLLNDSWNSTEMFGLRACGTSSSSAPGLWIINYRLRVKLSYSVDAQNIITQPVIGQQLFKKILQQSTYVLLS